MGEVTNIKYCSRTDGFPYPLDEVDKLEEEGLAKFEAYLAKKTTGNGCTLENAAKRQERYESLLSGIIFILTYKARLDHCSTRGVHSCSTVPAVQAAQSRPEEVSWCNEPL